MKIFKWFIFLNLFSLASYAAGSLQVNGEPGLYQYFRQVKAQRCSEPLRSYDEVKKRFQWTSGCDKAVYFDLNTPVELPEGNYILGYENSIFPGFLNLKSGEIKTVDLVKIEVPKSLRNDTSIRVFRDFSSHAEQTKLLFQYYYVGKHFFRMTNRYSFGDYYLVDPSKTDIMQRVDYRFCNLIKLYRVREHAQFVCDAWNSAQSFMDLADLFRFEYNGTFQEAWVTHPGDLQALKHSRHLVSAPITGKDFVSVFPGSYMFYGETSKKSVTVYKDDLPYLFPHAERRFSQKSNKDANVDMGASDISAEDQKALGLPVQHPDGVLLAQQQLAAPSLNANCANARMWRTDFRSYCTSDQEDGCDRTTVSICEEMKLDLRFKR